MLQTPDATTQKVTRTPRTGRTTRGTSKPHDSTDALLGTRCALDLPVLHQHIPASIKLTGTNKTDRVSDCLLHLALHGVESRHFSLADDKSTVQNLLRAAEAAIETALEPVTSPLGLDSSLWTSAHEAEKATVAAEIFAHDCPYVPEIKDYDGKEVMFVELAPGKSFKKAAASRCEYVELGQRAQAIESVCPGFTNLMYTVLDLVNSHLYPVFTPRTLFEDYISSGYRDGATSLTDSGIALAELEENYGELDEMFDKYGFTAETATHQDIIDIYQEEIGSYLPSHFITHFGSASLCSRVMWSSDQDLRHEELPIYRAPSLWSDLNIALANMEVRPKREASTRNAIRALQQLIDITREIHAGARFVTGANSTCTPSFYAVKVTPRAGSDFFCRVLDDSARSAMESGEVTEAVGWIVARADTPETTTQSLQSIHRGATATVKVFTFLKFIGEVA